MLNTSCVKAKYSKLADTTPPADHLKTAFLLPESFAV